MLSNMCNGKSARIYSETNNPVNLTIVFNQVWWHDNPYYTNIILSADDSIFAQCDRSANTLVASMAAIATSTLILVLPPLPQYPLMLGVRG